MELLADAILTRAVRLPEGTPVSTSTFLEMGTKPAIRSALLRLLRAQKLLRVGRGIYVVPVVSRFGSSAPSAHRFIEELSKRSGEDIVSSGATTANALGLTTQVPVQMVYWTSGRSRKLNLGKLVLHLEHVSSWQLVLAKEPAGEIVRVLAWAGPEHIHSVLKKVAEKVPRSEMVKVAQHGHRFPHWLADALISDCRHCLTVVAKAEGTLNSARFYSRIGSYALIVDEAIQGCPSRLRQPVAAAM